MGEVRILGAVLAGGRSTRFGSDKAAARLGSKPLIEHVITAIAPQVDAVVICGRSHERLRSIPDRPAPGLGPLGGLCAALHHASQQGFDAVLSVSCDTPLLPQDLVMRLRHEAPAFITEHPLIGLWPSALARRLDAHLEHEQDRSMRRWAAVAEARGISVAQGIPNVNTRRDLDALAAEESVACP